MNIQSFVLFLCIGAAFAQPRRPAGKVEIRNEHFSEPVIIENPNASISLLPAGHAAFLLKHPLAQGRDWTVLGHEPITKIMMSIDDHTVDTPMTLDDDEVTVEFDRIENGDRKHAGRVLISWQAIADKTGLLHLKSRSAGNRRLQWQRSGDSRRIAPVESDQYRVRLVHFYDSNGAFQCLPSDCQPITTEKKVEVAICTDANQDRCKAKP